MTAHECRLLSQGSSSSRNKFVVEKINCKQADWQFAWCRIWLTRWRERHCSGAPRDPEDPRVSNQSLSWLKLCCWAEFQTWTSTPEQIRRDSRCRKREYLITITRAHKRKGYEEKRPCGGCDWDTRQQCPLWSLVKMLTPTIVFKNSKPSCSQFKKGKKAV